MVALWMVGALVGPLVLAYLNRAGPGHICHPMLTAWPAATI